MRFLDTSSIRTLFNERVVAEDGVELSVDLYLPSEPGLYPVLLNRTPADNNRAGRAGISEAPAERWAKLAAQGYIIAAADVRGRGDSGGTFTPFVNEASDGAVTIAWLRNFSEANGKIGLFGSGYAAFCAWAAACIDGDIGAIVSSSPFGAVGEGLVHNGGVVRLDWLFWMHLIGGRTVQPPNVPPWPNIYRHLPLGTMDEALGRSDIWWRDWLEHLDPNDAFWDSLDLKNKVSSLNVPSLHITGWWDGQLSGARYYHQAMAQSDAQQHLIIGPWDTAAVRRPLSTALGGFDFGPASILDIDEELGKFFDENLKDEMPVPPRPRPRARLFVTGRNEWIERDKWPSTIDDHTLKLFLSSTQGANTRRGDGRLDFNPINTEAMDSFVHNPEMPVAFQHRFVGFGAEASPKSLALDQAHITARDESLVYTSEPLLKGVTVLGRARVKLSINVDAPDADLYVLLSDSFPGETRDLHLSHGVIRLSTLSSFRPDKLTAVTLELGEVAHDFLSGHQIRLTVTSSLFPLYARNLQTEKYVGADKPNLATIELYLKDSSLSFGVAI